MRTRFTAQICSAAFFLAAPALGAQQIRGAVTQAAGVPVVGAVVSALDSANRALASVATDTVGRYVLAWPAGAVAVRVLRMGFRPGSSPLSGSAHDVTVNFQLSVVTTLTAARVVSTPSCPNAVNRSATLELWDQARAGLLSAIVARKNRARMTLLEYNRTIDPGTSRSRDIATRFMDGGSSRPFVTGRSVGELERHGFAEMKGEIRVLHAPDADILLDDRFAATHCFGVKRDEKTHPGEVGLSFVPYELDRYPGRVDVEGVLWVDPRVPTLTELRFFFVGPNTAVGRTRAGGEINFVTMANGALIITPWSISIPVESRANFYAQQKEAAVMHESGGLVVDAAWPGGFAWHTSVEPIRGRVTDNQGRPLPLAVVSVDGSADTVLTDSTGAYALPLIPPGKYRIDFADTALQRFVAPRTTTRDVTVPERGRAEAGVQLRAIGPELALLCKGHGNPRDAIIAGHVTRNGPRSLGALIIESEWQSRIDFDLRGSFQANRQGVELDDRDRFVVCGVEHGRHVKLRLYLGSTPVADTALEVGKSGDFFAFEWAMPASAAADAARNRRAVLSGQVLDDRSGAPIADAEVWLVASGTQLRTDTAGRFESRDAFPGRQLIQVRRIGYVVVRDTITLSWATESARTWRMQNQAFMLDTVTTTSSTVKYISPGLREFENRRATGIGRYISEAEIRKYDDRSNAWMSLLKAIPNTRVTEGVSGEHLESTRGGVGRRPLADPENPRSPRGCWVTVFLDGMQLYLGPPQKAPDLRTLPTQQFAGIEYYGGNATKPPQFSGLATECGLLVLWSRER